MTLRPMRWDGTQSLQDMTDAQLERLVYNLQVAYADQLDANGQGYVYVGSGNTAIGTAVDTSATTQVAGELRVINDGIIQGYPAFPGSGTETDGTFNFRQNRSTPSAVSSANFNLNGLIHYDSSNDEFKPFSTEASLQGAILDVAIAEMRTGNEVGSYRIATSTPTNGGAGTWSNKGVVFTDTTFSAGNTDYQIYLKKNLLTQPGTIINPIGLDSDGGGTVTGNLREREIDQTDRLIQNVLLPALTRRMSNGLYYSVSTSSSGVNRGTFTNTRQAGVTNTNNLGFDTINGVYGTFYRSVSTPSGSASTVTTYYFNMLA